MKHRKPYFPKHCGMNMLIAEQIEGSVRLNCRECNYILTNKWDVANAR